MSDSRYEMPRRGHDQGYSYLDTEQTSGEDMLIDRGVDDLLDEGYSPPDHPTNIERWQNEHETLDDRVIEEEPDPLATLTYGDDPDDAGQPSETANDEWSGYDLDGNAAAPGARSGRLVAPDQGFGEDAESQALGTDVGIDGGAASAEEAAMHIEYDGEPDPAAE